MYTVNKENPQYFGLKKFLKKNRKKGLTKGRDFGIISGHSARGKRKIKTFERTSGEAKKVKKTS